MASSSARRSSIAVAATLLVAWLVCLRPASAAAKPSSSTLAGTPGPGTKLGIPLAKKLAKVGKKTLINKNYGSGDNDQLGSAAADNYGYVVYDVSVGDGATSTTFSSIVDISDAFVWVTAADCVSVVSACEYVTVYSWEGEGINTTGYIADQTFTVVGTEPVITGPVVFGCSTARTVPLDDESSIVGFSRGAYSFVSQLNISKFSYFLSPDDADSSEPDSQQSVLLLGEAAVPQTRRSHSTPLLRSAAYPDNYYVKLTGIQVDGEDLGGIPKGAFDLAAGGGSGGVVMSTLIAVTYLQSAAYAAVKRAIVGKIKSPAVDGSAFGDGGFDLCYDAQSVAGLTFPKLTLVFGGPDAPAMELTTVHYFYKDNATGLQCLTLLPMPAGLPFSSLLGTLLQTGTNMIYDVDGGQLTFEKAAAPPAGMQLMVVAYPLLAWVLLLL
ncbi:aspartic proteinase nepenthesin-1-like [Lolium rigidum]|uniref:aspartic proteinase nepenthesin-1-like n=1 Tax=Lolium rigidum TaxID=89674 RepID=UPI001F5D3081|nr:aspartic proteinase nepenthesin-1-like [Lolium rigidum]